VPRKKAPPKVWPITMGQASHIASLPAYAGTDAEIAREYGISEALVQQIREQKEFNGIRFG
jgi:hypothetical protein